MSFQVAEAFVRVRPNMTGFKSETESGVKGAFAGVGKIVGVTLGAATGFEIVKSAVSAAAQVQKSSEVIQNEFGKSGESLIKFADTAGVKLGAASTATLGFSAQMGILFKNMGFTTAAGAKMTQGWEKLGLAFNAVKGGGGEGAVEVLRRLQLAATGASTRGLRALGISLQSSTLQAKAFSEGITQSVTQALTPAQKALVTYQIAMQHMPQLLALAQKHSNDFANVQARLSASWEQAKVEIGKALLPAMSTLGNLLANVLPRAVRATIDVFGAMKDVIVGVANFVRPVFEPIIHVVERVRDAFKTSNPFALLRADFEKLGPAAKVAVVALGGIAAAFAAIAVTSFPITSIVLFGVALAEAYRHSATFRSIIGKVAEVLRGEIEPAVKRVAHAIKTGLGEAFAFVTAHKSAFEVLGAAVAGLAVAFGVLKGAIVAWQAVTKVATAVQTAFDVALDANPIGVVVVAIGALIGGLTVLFFKSKTVHNLLVAAFHGIEGAVKAVIPVFGEIGHALVWAFHQATPLVGAFAATLKTAFHDVVPILKPVIEVIAVVFVGTVKLAQAVWRHFGHTLVTYTKEVFHFIVGTIRNALEVIRGIFDFISGLLTLNWSKAWKGITEILGGAWHEIVQVLKSAGHVMEQFMVDLWHTIEKIVLEGILKVVNLLGKIPTGFTVFGQHFGFTNPFVGWSKSLQGTIDNIGKAGKQTVKSVQTISDATKKAVTSQNATQKKALTDLGNQTGKTVAKATTDGVTQGVTKTMPALADKISTAVQNAIQSAHKAIVASVQSAKNNLDKIGQDLAKTITDIQAKIGGAAGAVAGSPQGAAFAKLKKLIESGAPSFQIAKAQAELSGQLQNVGKSQKTQLQTQLGNLTALFDSGKINYRQFTERLHKILREDGLNMAQALKKVGPALADQLKAQIAALKKQAQAIAAVPAKFRGIGGAGGAADIKIIQPLQVIHHEQQKIAVAEAKAQAAALKQSARQTAYQQQMATVGVHVLPPKGGRGAPPRAPHVRVPPPVPRVRPPHVPPARVPPQISRSAPRHVPRVRPPQITHPAGPVGPAGPRTLPHSRTGVSPAHVAAAARTVSHALASVCNDIIQSGKDIVAAELSVRTPIEHLRRTEIRIADDAAKQRSSAIREARTTNTLLRRLNRARGPVPGFGKEPKGTAGHHARQAAAAGVKA